MKRTVILTNQPSKEALYRFHKAIYDILMKIDIKNHDGTVSKK